MAVMATEIRLDLAGQEALERARVDAINEALEELAALVYRPGGGAVDVQTGRILVGAPMGRNGHKAFGLTPMERDALRRHLAGQTTRPRQPWLYFNDRLRAWCVNVAEYPQLIMAKAWLLRHGLTLDSYRVAARVGRG